MKDSRMWKNATGMFLKEKPWKSLDWQTMHNAAKTSSFVWFSDKKVTANLKFLIPKTVNWEDVKIKKRTKLSFWNWTPRKVFKKS